MLDNRSRILIISLSFTLLFILGFLVMIIKGSFAETKNMSDDAINNLTKGQKEQPLKVASFITPHHLVAEKMIDEVFAEVAKKNKDSKIDQIILMSPNHFNLGNGWLIVRSDDWFFDEGKINTDKEIAQRIVSSGIASEDNTAFQKEHGIRALLPFFQKHFNGVKIITLMVSDDIPIEKVDEFSIFLNEDISGNSLVVLSADFSHYLNSNISDFHDQNAEKVIGGFRYEDVRNLDIDCRGGLKVLMKYSQFKKFNSFKMVNNSNSSRILKKDFIGENTSYLTGYFEKGSSIKEESVNFLFLGDLMLDRQNRLITKERGVEWFTEDIERLFWGQDYNVVNLEGPVTENKSVSNGTTRDEKNHFKFTFDPDQTSAFLKKNKLNLVGLANNHIMNQEIEGLDYTKKFLNESDVNYFGDISQGNVPYLIKERNGIKFAIIGYSRFSGGNFEEVKKNIVELNERVDFVIVYAHWGKEYKKMPSEIQINKAHDFIDLGADLIIGAHPHVIQPIEVYKNKVIFYSLGNFLFDQYFSEDVMQDLSVGVALNKKGSIEFRLIPLQTMRDGKKSLANELVREKILQEIADNSIVDDSLKNEIKLGYFRLE